MKNNETTPFTPISELSKQLDLPAHTLRYWEKEFPEKISPVTGAGGRRYYRPETVENITAIKNYAAKGSSALIKPSIRISDMKNCC